MLGYIVVLFGIVGVGENIYSGVGFLILGLWFAFTNGVIELDSETKRFRQYPFLFGVKLGRWRSVVEYKDIAVLGSTINETTYGGMTSRSVTTKNKGFEICLLTQSHRKKIVIARFKNKEKAVKMRNEIGECLHLRVTKYNPVISNTTRKRR